MKIPDWITLERLPPRNGCAATWYARHRTRVRPVSDARGATATLVAPSPVTTPDGMVLR